MTNPNTSRPDGATPVGPAPSEKSAFCEGCRHHEHLHGTDGACRVGTCQCTSFAPRGPRGCRGCGHLKKDHGSAVCRGSDDCWCTKWSRPIGYLCASCGHPDTFHSNGTRSCRGLACRCLVMTANWDRRERS
jgi:hypothetical protein